MKRLTLMTLVSLMLMAFVATATAAQPADCQSAKIKSVDFLVDSSASMMKTHKKEGQRKILLAKNALNAVNAMIPELGYIGSIHTFSPTEQIVAPQVFNRSTFAAGFNKLRTSSEVQAHKGDGYGHWWHNLYSRFPSPLAVIIVSDGESTRIGSNPLATAQAILAANPGMNFHVISVADSEKGQAALDNIAKMRPGNTIATAKDLIGNPTIANQFVLDVFCGSQKIVLRNLQFGLNSSEINIKSAPILDELADMIRGRNVAITISGHTCDLGSAEHNQRLSERRAAAVKAYLVSKGVPANSMVTRGFGSSQPEFSNSNEEGRSQNRRVEIDFH